MLVSLDYKAKNNSCTVTIPEEYRNVRENLRKAFSTPNKAKRFTKYYHASNYLYFISPLGTFNFGIAELVIKWLKENTQGIEIEWNLSDAFKERFKRETNVQFRDELNFTLRDYQKEAVLNALKYKFGTFVMGTGAGKTLTIASILDNLFYFGKIRRALIIVPDNGLVLQFNDELTKQYGLNENITLFYDRYNTITENDRLVIANRPLFLTRWYQYEDLWRNSFDCLIVDEAHSLKRDNEISKCISKIVTEYRFGFTGTLAENTEDKFKCLGLLGPVRYEKTSKELRDEGFLSEVVVHRLQIKYSQKYRAEDYNDEINYLEHLENRNQFITKLVFGLEKNTLLLVNHLDYGFLLESMFNEINEKLENKRKIYFIRGEVEDTVREEIRKMMETDNTIICIAITKIFSTGINIKNLHNIVLCLGGKSSVTTVQSIGRGLRLHPEKKELNIFDLIDSGHKYSLNHGRLRKEIYTKEKINQKNYKIEL